MSKKNPNLTQLQYEQGVKTVQNQIDLIEYGTGPIRGGLKRTPQRVVDSWAELYAGYSIPVESILTVFDAERYDQMIILKGFEFYSMCEHHMLPFYGTAYVAYIPSDKIVGISKLARLVDIYSRRLQNQERITTQITDALDKYLDPIGTACVLKATHMCMKMRGVQKAESEMITSSMSGIFKTDQNTRNEFLQLIK